MTLLQQFERNSAGRGNSSRLRPRQAQGRQHICSVSIFLVATTLALLFSSHCSVVAYNSAGQPPAASSAMNAARRPTTRKPLIIFCHGSGDTGTGAKAWIESLTSSSSASSLSQQFQWIFPTAKPIPYQLNRGMISSIWYDRVGGFEPTFPEQTATVEQSTDQLLQLIEEQIQELGISPSQIAIGGFSMGGAIALQTAARWHALRVVGGSEKTEPLGAVFGLSCYLNEDSKVWELLKESKNGASSWPPTFMAHGTADDFILPQWGQATFERLEQNLENKDDKSSFHPFQYLHGAHHEMTSPEISDVLQFLTTHLVEQPAAEACGATASTSVTKE